MHKRPSLLVCAATALAVLAGGCAHPSARSAANYQVGESVVLAGEKPGRLAFPPDFSKPITLRSTYRTGLSNTIYYEQGWDYVVNPAGQIRRTPDSRIPDFGTNILYGKEDFDHGKFAGYGNNAFFAYADYFHPAKWGPVRSTNNVGSLLENVRRKLEDGKTVRIVAFGDSITAGGEASEPRLIFWERWAESLRHRYQGATIEAVNGATGGDTTANGLQRLQNKVIDAKPDLVLIGFGMNDHNRAGYGVPLETFAANLTTMIDRIRAETGAEIILYSAFPPNPKWHYGSHNMAAYAAATQKVARQTGCAYVDVYNTWMSIADHKQPEDLLANNINHPNDFGHWIYLQAFLALDL